MNHSRMHKNLHKCTVPEKDRLETHSICRPFVYWNAGEVRVRTQAAHKKKLYGDLTLNIHTFCAKSSRCSSLLVLKCTYITMKKNTTKSDEKSVHT